MTWLMPFGIIALADVLVLAFTPEFVFILPLVGMVVWCVPVIPMVGELNAVTGNTSFTWWSMLIPLYNIYWMVGMLPAEVTKAKWKATARTPTRGSAVYFFLLPYALAADLNDIAQS